MCASKLTFYYSDFINFVSVGLRRDHFVYIAITKNTLKFLT